MAKNKKNRPPNDEELIERLRDEAPEVLKGVVDFEAVSNTVLAGAQVPTETTSPRASPRKKTADNAEGLPRIPISVRFLARGL